ncbi:hypothetical protein ANN_17787 [Periplaneta americana]|uniref:CCHC-type domain-containing protein n=1 Tax=Periplaneta americana TaxID=6978 RepID=A0ABQ8SVF5_PERAM|nr:hypothetical protein ANN_17787 [Periplaneta americana]
MDTINRNLQIENYNRKNTIKIQFAQSATRSSAQEIHQWIVKKMVINTDQVDTLQLHNRERAIYLKVTTATLYNRLLDKYQGEIEFQYESGEITHVNIGPPDSASVTVRVFNLPPEIPSSVLQTVLNKYGTIQDIRNETWSTQYLLPVYNGVKAVRMNNQKNIPATIQVASYTANITYPGQPQACFVCGDTTHMKQDCPQRTVSVRLQPRNTPRLLSEVVKFNLSEPQNTDVNTAVDEFSENKSLRNDDENSDLQCITNVHDTMDTNTNAPSISSTPPTEALIRCKRPIPPSESSSSNPPAHIDSLSEVSPYNTDGETTANPNNHSKLNPPRKKSKKVKPPTLDEQLHPVKHILEATPSEFILNYTQLKSLYENTVGVTDILKVALSYTNDTEGLIEMLQKLYPHYQDKDIKNRTTRIENCLRAIISMESDNKGETDAVDNIQTPIHP